MTDTQAPPPGEDLERIASRRFASRVIIVCLFSTATIAVWKLSNLLVLAFGAALLALLLRGLADELSRRTRLPAPWAVLPVIIALLGSVAAVSLLFGSQIAAQFNVLAKDLPEGLTRVTREFAESSFGAFVLGRAQDANLGSITGQVAGYVAALFGSVFRTGAYVAVLLFAAVYLAAQPARYVGGVLRLVPAGRRQRAREMLDLLAATLTRWLIGQSVTMAVVGTLTAIGLLLLGVAAPFALGIVSGMFAFVPYVSPILASALAILMAAVQGPTLAVYVVALYAVIHLVESSVITPLVQAEAIELPPVLTLFATLVFGLLLGPVGVLLAAPLAVVLLVAINAIYIEGVLGEPRVWPSGSEHMNRRSVGFSRERLPS